MMLDETVPRVVATAKIDNDGFQLTGRELRLIRNFRAVKPGAQEMLLDLSEQYKRTLPATPPVLRLLRSED